MSKISDLQNRKNQLIADAQVLVNNNKANSEEYRAMIAELDATTETLQLISRSEKFFESQPKQPAAVAPVVRPETREERKSKLNEAFRQYLRTESVREEYRDIFTASGGSPLIPQDVFPVLGEVAKYFAPLLDYVTVEENPTARPTKFVNENDSTNFLTVSSEGSAATEVDQTFSETILSHDLITGTVTASRQLVDDSKSFDLTQLITRAAGKRLGRSYDSIIVNGRDPASNSAPNNQGLVNVATVGITTSTLANGVSMSDLAALVESVDPTWWSKAIFLLSGGTYQYLMKQVDGMGRRFWPELGEGRLWQWPVVISNALPQTLNANGVPILFGDLSTYGVSHTGLSVQVLRERFVEQLKYGFVLSSRIASQQLSPGGYKALKLAAA